MAKKRLYRSKKDRIIGGVCGGIAEHVDTDPTLIRLIWALGSLAWGAGILVHSCMDNYPRKEVIINF